MSRIVKHVSVRGRVQAVGFRAFVEHHARQRGVEGWVRNRRDGSVEAVFAGEAGSVDGLIRACKVGPLGARVDAIHQREASEDDFKLGGGAGFACLPTE